jgi:hypothetical protein
MAKYHATVKRLSDGMPQRVLLDAEHIGKAIELMCAACSVNSTGDLAEFEILEVIAKDNYRVAARKMASQYKPVVKAPLVPAKDKEDDPYDERSYHPYKLRAA